MTKDKNESSEKVTIVRKAKKNNFSIISNEPVQNKNLSWKAKGILWYLLQLPDDWKINLVHLEKQATDGRESLKSGFKELKKNGYIEHDTIREKGKIIGHIWIVHETPILKIDKNDKEPEAGKPSSGFTTCGKPATTNNEENIPITKTTTTPHKKKETNKPKVSEKGGGFFECLKEIKISDKDKIRLSKNYPEELVARVLSYVTQKGFKLKTSLDRAIFHYCQNPDQIQETQEEISRKKQKEIEDSEEKIRIRKSLASEISKKIHKDYKNWRTHIGFDYLEIGDYEGHITHKIFFKSPKFSDDLQDVLDKLKIKLKIPIFKSEKNNFLNKN